MEWMITRHCDNNTCHRRGKVMQGRVSALNHAPACSLSIIRFFSPGRQRLFPKDSGKRRKETSCLTGSLGVLSVLGTSASRPDKESFLSIRIIP